MPTQAGGAPPLAFLIMRNLYPGLFSPLDFLCLSTHVSRPRQKVIGEISMADMTSLNKALVFGLVAASTLVLLILIGVASSNVAPNMAQLNTESPAATR